MNYESFWTNTKNKIAGWLGVENAGMNTAERMLHNERASALQYFDGDAPRQLAIKRGQPDDNVFINYPELIVAKGVEFLFGKELKISVGSDADSDAESSLDELWPAAQRAEDLIDCATDGAVFGTAWLKIVLDAEGVPGVIVPDPMNISVESDPRDYRRVNKFICQYRVHENANGCTWYREETERAEDGAEAWVIREFESKTGERWTQTGEEIYWNYSFPPYFYAKNLPRSKSFYGKPDLTKSVLELCKYLSRLDSLIGKIIRVHASPKPFAKGLQKQDLQVGTEDVLFLGLNPEASLGLLEMTGDLAGALMFRKTLREALAEISKVPEVATGKTESIGELSGFALQILYSPILSQTMLKRRLYGQMLERVIAALLEIAEVSEGEQVRLEWSSPLPVSLREDAETAMLQKQIGVSENTLLKRLGFDPVHEASMRANEVNSLGNVLGKTFGAGADGEVFQ